MAISIDVVIPSFRLNEHNLLPILTLRVPASARVVYYLIVDNPQADIPDSIRAMADDRNIFLLWNEKNKGASYTRNRGMEAGMGEWILFLDDDLTVPRRSVELPMQALPMIFRKKRDLSDLYNFRNQLVISPGRFSSVGPWIFSVLP